MVDEIIAVTGAIGDALFAGGTMALIGLAGFGVYKLLTLASVLMLARYGIERVYKLVEKALDRPSVCVVKLGHLKFISGEEGESGLGVVLARLASKSVHGYIHDADIQKLNRAVTLVLEDKA